ncbi:MAG TPA: GMC oxidoreductase [Spongiibacteraceae bacterium]|jgi:cholesterol oxidase
MDKRITRRHFLQAGTIVATGSALFGCGGSSSRHTKQAVVIGSGFGGAVTALRLGQAGIKTMVLERGRSWTLQGPDTFPLMSGSNDGRTTWLGTTSALIGSGAVPRYTGMIERVTGDTIDAVCGAGVGGGSLVYGSVLLQPQRDVFNQVLPFIDYDEMATIYYPRVLSHISGGPIPDDILAAPEYRADVEFIQTCTAAGFEIIRTNVGFNWNTIRSELSGAIPKAASIGEYVYGCNSGAKNTLDKNYLADATATGNVTIQPLRVVTSIRERRNGLYEVHGDAIDTEGNVVETFIVVADYVFLAAGSLNTSKLMLKCQASGDLPGLNQWVGKNWGTNGDELLFRVSATPVSGAQGGPPAVASIDVNNTIKPVTFMHSPASVPIDLQLQLAMSVPDQLGTMSYDASSDTASIHWPLDAQVQARAANQQSFLKMIAAGGGAPLTIGAKPTIWHPVGGMTMGFACSELGEVHGQQNMFVVDGSLMPGSTACANPSLTIAANAERIMDTLIPRLR